MAQHIIDLPQQESGESDDDLARIIDLTGRDSGGSAGDVTAENAVDLTRPETEQESVGRDDPTGQGSGGSDGDLARWAAAGDSDSFEELYRRHAESAWSVAYAVAANRDDAADAVAESFARVLSALETGRLEDTERFRSYLLATARNAAIDAVRRAGRQRSVDDLPDAFADGGGGAGDHAVGGIDARLVANAFRSLPERWRSVLWLTEVEGMPASEAAGLIGVSANGAAQLAVRARAGLRERFLQAHLRDGVDADCRVTVDHLGAYVGGGGLSPRDTAKVDEHLAGCPACEERRAELEDLGGNLRRAAVPLPAALAGLAWAHWREVCTGWSRSRRAVAVPFSAHRALMGASVGLLGVGIIGATMMGRSPFSAMTRPLATPAAHSGSHARGAPPAPPGSDPLANELAAASDGADLGWLGTPSFDTSFDSSLLGGSGADFVPAMDTPAATGDNGSGYWGPGYWSVPMATPAYSSPSGGAAPAPSPPPPSPPPPPPQVNVGVSPAPLPAPVSAGAGTGSQTGASVGPVTIGTPPPPPPPGPLPGVSVSAPNPVTGGSTTVTVP